MKLQKWHKEWQTRLQLRWQLSERNQARLTRLGMETHVSLPLFLALLLTVIWAATFHFIETEGVIARQAAADSVRELSDTYEAQVVRNLGGIDQTLKVIKYAIELKGPADALPELERQGLLPSSLVFAVSFTDRSGHVIASTTPANLASVAGKAYFTFHQSHDSDSDFVSPSVRDGAQGAWNMHFTRRLNDTDGRFAGIAIVEVDPQYFTSGYESSRLGERGMLGLFGADGAIRALRVGEKATSGQHAQIPTITASEEPIINAWDGVSRYTRVRPLHGFALSVVVGLAEDEQMAAFEHHRRNIFWEVGIGSALLMLVWSWQGSKNWRSVRRAQETYAAASEANMDAFFVLHSMRDKQGAITDFKIAATNTCAEQMTGLSKQDLQRRTLCELLPSSRENGLLDKLAHAAKIGGVHQEEWENRSLTGSSRWLHRQVVGVEGGIVAIVRDISERKRAEARILHMAQHDALTGLPNRSMLGERLQQAILNVSSSTDSVLVAFIDIDSFKQVNDGLGHKMGDELLKVLAARMQQCLRKVDTVSRFGGDEFVLVLPQQQHGGNIDATQIVERIRETVSMPVMLNGHEVKVSCSIGVAIYPHNGNEPETLLANADAAMYRAKETGKNNFKFYTEEMNASVVENLALLEALRHALDEDQLRLLYQPKVDLNTGLIFGVEALLRWHHPVHGVISPLRFIPLAENSGLIIAIGQWVLQTACRQSRAWQKAGLAPITMSVNVSPRQFDDTRLVEGVAEALAESGLAPSCLELEVTESLIMRDLQQAIEKMRELQAMGLSLSIDDFGTGYSSLSALKSFPISRLKIDRSFVNDLATSADDQAIARAIIALSHQLHLRVIAEGVETQEQHRFLLDNGCDEMQGYLFSRPVPAPEIQAMLEQQKSMSSRPLVAA